jgi:hypothetical protein
MSRCTHRRKVARRGVLIVQIIDYRNQAITLIIGTSPLFERITGDPEVTGRWRRGPEVRLGSGFLCRTVHPITRRVFESKCVIYSLNYSILVYCTDGGRHVQGRQFQPRR